MATWLAPTASPHVIRYDLLLKICADLTSNNIHS
jgi:hypothetical protein